MEFKPLTEEHILEVYKKFDVDKEPSELALSQFHEDEYKEIFESYIEEIEYYFDSVKLDELNEMFLYDKLTSITKKITNAKDISIAQIKELAQRFELEYSKLETINKKEIATMKATYYAEEVSRHCNAYFKYILNEHIKEINEIIKEIKENKREYDRFYYQYLEYIKNSAYNIGLEL